jgi:hypothetical protein
MGQKQARLKKKPVGGMPLKCMVIKFKKKNQN